MCFCPTKSAFEALTASQTHSSWSLHVPWLEQLLGQYLISHSSPLNPRSHLQPFPRQRPWNEHSLSHVLSSQLLPPKPELQLHLPSGLQVPALLHSFRQLFLSQAGPVHFWPSNAGSVTLLQVQVRVAALHKPCTTKRVEQSLPL